MYIKQPNDQTRDFNCGNILIIDDSETNTRILANMLNNNGFLNTSTLSDTSDFVRVFNKIYPDLVLLDIMMPQPDGFEILEWLKTNDHLNSIPVIVITALDDQMSKQRALNLGANDYVAKPFEKLEIITRVKNLLHLREIYKRLENTNLELEQKVRKKTAEINNTQIEIIERLMRAAEFRDNETGDHISRISRYVFTLCLKLGLKEQEAELISLACKMHDIGKIGISDQILSKPGKLDVFEMDSMKTHVEIGAQILSGSSNRVVQIAEQIARSHHEKWDGSGYPNGLAGEDIPLAGRITAVADVLDALLSSRVYKREWRFDDAIRYISEQSGRHFDPCIVKALLAVQDAIKSILTENSLSK